MQQTIKISKKDIDRPKIFNFFDRNKNKKLKTSKKEHLHNYIYLRKEQKMDASILFCIIILFFGFISIIFIGLDQRIKKLEQKINLLIPNDSKQDE